MFQRTAILILLIAALTAATAVAHDHPAKGEKAKAKAQPTVAEQMAGLQGMCAESADARTARHEAKPLFHRLGGRDKITAMVGDVLVRHRANDTIKHTMKGVDDAKLTAHLVDFIAAGTGGGGKYTGRSMPDAHAHLDLTDAHFLAAGGDIIAAMKAMDYGQNEIDEFVCILVSMKDLVVLK